MATARDLTGERFGMLTVVSYAGGASASWNCQCDCGAEHVATGSNLRHERTRSCGCQRRLSRGWMDITGQRYGRLVALRRLDNRKWLCACDCGKTKAVALNKLRRGDVISCRCAFADMLRRRNATLNPQRRKPELGALEGKERRRVAARLYYQTSDKCKAKHKIQSGARWARMKLVPVAERLTPAQWLAILDACDHRCAYCNQKSDRLTIDHMTPIARGGGHVWMNVIPACWGCNSRKHTRPLGEALDLLQVDRDRFWATLHQVEERLSAA